MKKVVMKALYGMNYVVAKNLTEEEALDMQRYLRETCSDEYLDNLLVKAIVIENM